MGPGAYSVSIEVRERIDGELKSIVKFSNKVLPSLAVRIKIMGKLNISESRKPQDGRMRIMINDRDIDLRISIVPTFYGEKIELRVLDAKEAKIELDKIGFRQSAIISFRRKTRIRHSLPIYLVLYTPRTTITKMFRLFGNLL